MAVPSPFTSSPSPPATQAPSTSSLLREVASATRELVQVEVALARQELGENLSQARRAAIVGGVALALSLVLLTTLAFALVLALGGTVLVTLGVAGGLVAIAAGLLALAYRMLPKKVLGRSRARLQEELVNLKQHAGFGDEPPLAGARLTPAKSEPATGIRGRLASVVSTLKQTGAQWSEDEAARLAASLALYTLLSIAPLLVIAISVAGMVFGAEAARGQISQQIATLVGPEAGKAIEGLVANAQNPSSGIVSSIVGTVVLLFGASGVFGELQSALNRIWEVKPKPGRGIMGMLRDRFLSFSMVMGVAFLLLVSLVVSAGLAGMTGFFQTLVPLPALWHVVDVVVGIALSTVIFALMFKVVPDVKIAWRDVWVGGLATAVAFSMGRIALAWYVGRSATVSPFGAAGSLVALIVWIYYSAQILFMGAEFAQVYAARHGSRIVPSNNAVPIDQPDGESGARGAAASS